MRHIAASAQILWQLPLPLPPPPHPFSCTATAHLLRVSLCAVHTNARCKPRMLISIVTQYTHACQSCQPARVAPALVNWFMRSRKLHPHPKRNFRSIAFHCTVWPEIRISIKLYMCPPESPRSNSNGIWNEEKVATYLICNRIYRNTDSRLYIRKYSDQRLTSRDIW